MPDEYQDRFKDVDWSKFPGLEDLDERISRELEARDRKAMQEKLQLESGIPTRDGNGL